MRQIAWVLVVAAIGPAFSACMGLGGSFSVGAPSWQPGFSFAYTSSGSYSYAVAANGETETRDGTWGPETHIAEVLNTTLEADGEPVYVLGFQTVERDEAPEDDPESEAVQDVAGRFGLPVGGVSFLGIRKRDFQEIPAWLNTRSDCDTSGGCTTEVVGLEFGDAPPYSMLEFPLEKGKDWSHDLDAADTQLDDFADDLRVRFEAHVVGLRNVPLPMGDARAVRVDWRIAPTNLDEYNTRIREEAEKEGADIDRFEISFSRSGSVYFSENYMTIVQSEWRGDFAVEIRGKAPDGEEFDFTQRGNDQGKNVLEGARYVGRAERGLDYFARLHDGKVSLQDPTGQSLDRVRYSIRVNASKTVVNAAESEAAEFAAVVEGVEALPEGHSVAWKVRDFVGGVVATGTGLAFSHTFDEPGQFVVEAEGHDESGNVTASGGVDVAANYQASVQVDCPPVAGVGLGTCEAIPVPVRPGIRYLKAEAAVDSPVGFVPALNAAELVLEDPDGHDETGNRNGDRYTIEMFQFFRFEVGDEDWTLQLQQQRAVLESATYEVDLRYDDSLVVPVGFPFGVDVAALRRWVQDGGPV